MNTSRFFTNTGAETPELQTLEQLSTKVGYGVTLVFIVFTLFFTAMGDSFFARPLSLAIWLCGALTSRFATSRGHSQTGIWTLGLGGFASSAFLVWHSGGSNSIYTELYPLLILAAGLLGGWRLSLSITSLCIGFTGFSAWAQSHSMVPPNQLLSTPFFVFAQQLSIASTMAVCVGFPLARIKSAAKIAQDQLKAEQISADGFLHLFQQSGAAMALTERDIEQGERGVRGIAANQAFQDLFGFEINSFAIEPELHLALWRDKHDLRRAADELDRFGRVGPMRACFLCQDGTELVCKVDAAPLAWKGKPCLLWCFHDLTSTSKLSLELEDLNHGLEARATAQAKELATAKTLLAKQERLALLGGMISGVAHEINTPIGNAMIAASALDEPASKLLSMADGKALSRAALTRATARISEAAEMTLDNINRAAGIIRSFKQLSADQTGQTRRLFIAEDVVGDALKIAAPAMRTARIHWTLVPSSTAGFSIEGYPGALSQIATILVNNCLIHAFDDSNADNSGNSREILVSCSTLPGDILEITFNDNGCGIPQEDFSRVFTPFYSVDDKSRSGLGLAIAYNLATEALGGSLCLASSPGKKGSNLCLRLPNVSPIDAQSSR